jgi:ATP-binding cassette subfamily B protein
VETAFRHTMMLPVEWWQGLAFDESCFLGPLRRRLRHLRVPAARADPLLADACADRSGGALATLDAAVRMAESIVQARAVPRGRPAAELVDRLLSDPDHVPPACFFVRRHPVEPDQVLACGAVILAIEPPPAASPDRGEPGRADASDRFAALRGPELEPLRELVRVVARDGWRAPLAGAAVALLGALGAVLQNLLFRGLIDVWDHLVPRAQELGAIALALGVLLYLYADQIILYRIAHRIGRHAEVRLRAALLDKLARLGDLYFRSRLLSDLADRAHRTHEVRLIPVVALELVHVSARLAAIVALMAALDPATLPLAVCAAVLVFAIPVSLGRALEDAKLRAARHSATLSRFLLDALLGVVPLRAHGGAPALRREHEEQLGEWAQASLAHQRLAVACEGLQLVAGFGLAAWLVLAHFGRHRDGGALLVIVFWSFQIPVLGQQIAFLARSYPALRASLVRTLEPLCALEQGVQAAADRDGLVAADAAAGPASPPAPGPEPGGDGAPAADDLTDIVPLDLVRSRRHARRDRRAAHGRAAPDRAAASGPGVRVVFDRVTVRMSGITLLRSVDLEVGSGEHVALLGASGAGKSSLLAVLLGLYPPSSGRVLADGEPLVDEPLDRLRARTAWVDPQVRLWNESLLANLLYGNALAPDRAAWAVRASDLLACMERLERGLQTSLGEGGVRLSGGEGQRVRYGRTLGREQVGLVLLDEPFRGLDRLHRRRMTERARAAWSGATLFCVTHDATDTEGFDRAVVIGEGAVLEDGPPAALLRRDSVYREMFLADRRTGEELWSSDEWRRVIVGGGRVEG